MAYGGCFCPDGRFSVSVAPGSARAPGALRNGQQNAPLLSDSADSVRLCRNELRGTTRPPQFNDSMNVRFLLLESYFSRVYLVDLT